MLSIKKRIVSGFCLLLLPIITSCHHLKNDSSPEDRMKATAIAQRFLTALDSGNSEEILKISSAPFWGDGDYIALRSELESIVKQETTHPHNKIKNYKTSHVVPFHELEAVNPRMYRALNKKMPTEGLHAVFLVIETHKGITAGKKKTRREHALILIKKDKSNRWTVVGIKD